MDEQYDQRTYLDPQTTPPEPPPPPPPPAAAREYARQGESNEQITKINKQIVIINKQIAIINNRITKAGRDTISSHLDIVRKLMEKLEVCLAVQLTTEILILHQFLKYYY